MKNPTLGKLLDAMMQAVPAFEWNIYRLPLAPGIRFAVVALLPRDNSYIMVSAGEGGQFAACAIHVDGPHMWLTPYFKDPKSAFDHALHRSMNFPPDMVAETDEKPNNQRTLRVVSDKKQVIKET